MSERQHQFNKGVLLYNHNEQVGGKTYSDKVLKLFVLLLELFEDIHSLHVMTAELAIQLFHLLSIFIRELKETTMMMTTNKNL